MLKASDASVKNRKSGKTWKMRRARRMPWQKTWVIAIRRQRFGNDSGIEPLIIEREFHGIRPDYEEISEEFRLFHELYHDRKENRYYKIDDTGNEDLVAIVETDHIRIRLKEIRQFMAVKEMHLAIYFDCREFSPFLLDELGLKEGGTDHREELLRWHLYYGDFRGWSSGR